MIYKSGITTGATLLGAAALLTLGATSMASAHEENAAGSDGVIILAQVTPEEEKAIAAELQASGPSETTGIKNVRLMGTVPLAGQFESVEGRQLRAREIDIEPGGVVAVHQHTGRPGVAYIVSGQLTEHRAGADGPVVKHAGDTAFEQTGTVHWWQNDGDTIGRVIVVDIVPIE